MHRSSCGSYFWWLSLRCHQKWQEFPLPLQFDEFPTNFQLTSGGSASWGGWFDLQRHRGGPRWGSGISIFFDQQTRCVFGQRTVFFLHFFGRTSSNTHGDITNIHQATIEIWRSTWKNQWLNRRDFSERFSELKGVYSLGCGGGPGSCFGLF